MGCSSLARDLGYNQIQFTVMIHVMGCPMQMTLSTPYSLGAVLLATRSQWEQWLLIKQLRGCFPAYNSEVAACYNALYLCTHHNVIITYTLAITIRPVNYSN